MVAILENVSIQSAILDAISLSGSITIRKSGVYDSEIFLMFVRISLNVSMRSVTIPTKKTVNSSFTKGRVNIKASFNTKSFLFEKV